MKKLLIILLVLPITVIAQTKKPRQTTKKAPKETHYYYDSLGVKRNRDSAINAAVEQTIESMKAKGYVKPN